MIVHCNGKLVPDIILFLHDTERFYKRTFQIVTCPRCNKTIGLLTQYLKDTNEYRQIKFKETAKTMRAYRKYKQETNYTSRDIVKNTGTYGLRYGDFVENKKNGKVVGYTIKAKDFYGGSEVLEKIQLFLGGRCVYTMFYLRGEFFLIMKNTKGIKRELTSDEWRAISVMWVKGESTKAICAAFPKCHINSAMIRRRMNKDNVNLLKDEIDEEVKATVKRDLVADKVQYTEKVIGLYNDTLDVIRNIVNEYKEEDFERPAKRHATAYNLDQLAGALNKCQNGLRTALGMDKDGNLVQKEAEQLKIVGLDLDKI